MDAVKIQYRMYRTMELIWLTMSREIVGTNCFDECRHQLTTATTSVNNNAKPKEC